MGELRWGAFAPQGWKLEYSGWGAADAWARTKEISQLAERTGYHHLWVYDHVETVPRREPTHMFEAYTMLSALAQHTSTVKLGQLVTCAAYRNAGLLAVRILAAPDLDPLITTDPAVLARRAGQPTDDAAAVLPASPVTAGGGDHAPA